MSYVKKTNQKLYALAQYAKYNMLNMLSTDKKLPLFKAFVVSQFNYCHLVWMF